MTRWQRTIASLAVGALFVSPFVEAHDLMPAPASVELREDGFPLGGSLTVALAGPADDRLMRALERFASRLSVRMGRSLALDVVEDSRRAALQVRVAGEGARFPTLEDEESYRLEVTGDRVGLEAPGPLGVIRGLATLAQLVAPEDDGWILTAATIDDAPRFPWRGLKTGAMEDLAGFVYDRKGTILFLLALAAFTVLIVRRRRARRAA